MCISVVKLSKVLLFLFLLTFSAVTLSQNNQTPSVSEPDVTSQIDQLTDEFDEPPSEESQPSNRLQEADKLTLEYRLAQQNYIYLEVIVLAGMAIISLVIVLAFMKTNQAYKPRDIVNAAGLILVPFSTVILVLVADSQEQISAAIGVLGAIAGYLFGAATTQRSGKS